MRARKRSLNDPSRFFPLTRATSRRRRWSSLTATIPTARAHALHRPPAETTLRLWIQYRSGKVHTLILTNGKIVVLGFTTSEMALRVLDLIVQRFPGDDLLIAQTEGSARATFEQGCVADGARAEDYWFVYEGTDEFTKIIASLEVQQAPPA